MQQGRQEAYVEREAVAEAERAEEAEALVLGAGAAVADDDGAAHHRRASARGEDLRRTPARRLRLRLRQPYRSHRLAPSRSTQAQKWEAASVAWGVTEAGRVE